MVCGLWLIGGDASAGNDCYCGNKVAWQRFWCQCPSGVTGWSQRLLCVNFVVVQVSYNVVVSHCPWPAGMVGRRGMGIGLFVCNAAFMQIAVSRASSHFVCDCGRL